MNEVKDINLFQKLQKMISLFQRINQLSWTADQTRKRYPAPEMMNKEELEALLRLYIALGMDIEEISEDWKKLYNDYKHGKSKT